MKFVYEAFKKLRPGIPLKCLHGRMNQNKRMAIFFQYCEERRSVLFSTDVASRGLDFPAVEWVVQVIGFFMLAFHIYLFVDLFDFHRWTALKM